MQNATALHQNAGIAPFETSQNHHVVLITVGNKCKHAVAYSGTLFKHENPLPGPDSINGTQHNDDTISLCST